MKYHRPTSLREYRKILDGIGNASHAILAGGTDIIAGFEGGQILPDNLIDIKAIADLKGIRKDKQHVEIGALTSIETLRRDDYIRQHFPALAQAGDEFGSAQIRHRATVGGNIVNASPAGDTLPALYIYKAAVKIQGVNGERVAGIQDFILSPGKVDLRSGEMVQSIQLPMPKQLSLFYKLGLRQAMAIAVVNYAILYNITDRQFTELSIAAGAVAPRVVFLDTLTKAVVSEGVTPEQAVDLVEADIAPIDDIRATARYRRTVLKNLLLNTLTELLADGRKR